MPSKPGRSRPRDPVGEGDWQPPAPHCSHHSERAESKHEPARGTAGQRRPGPLLSQTRPAGSRTIPRRGKQVQMPVGIQAPDVNPGADRFRDLCPPLGPDLAARQPPAQASSASIPVVPPAPEATAPVQQRRHFRGGQDRSSVRQIEMDPDLERCSSQERLRARLRSARCSRMKEVRWTTPRSCSRQIASLTFLAQAEVVGGDDDPRHQRGGFILMSIGYAQRHLAHDLQDRAHARQVPRSRTASLK